MPFTFSYFGPSHATPSHPFLGIVQLDIGNLFPTKKLEGQLMSLASKHCEVYVEIKLTSIEEDSQPERVNIFMERMNGATASKNGKLGPFGPSCKRQDVGDGMEGDTSYCIAASEQPEHWEREHQYPVCTIV